jgi:hypothetical protein
LRQERVEAVQDAVGSRAQALAEQV